MSSIFVDVMLFVITVLVIAFSAGFIVALVYFVGIMKNLKEFSDNAKKEMHAITKDINDLRAEIKKEFATWKGVSILGMALIEKIGRSFVDAKKAPKKTRNVKAKTTEATEAVS